MTGKPELRATLRARRDAIDASARAAACERIAEHGLAVLAPRVRAGAIVAAYWLSRGRSRGLVEGGCGRPRRARTRCGLAEDATR